MTLNVTVLTPTTIYQSADFRLTNFDTGEVITDSSPKTVTFTFRSWLGFITYTGVGSWRNQDISTLIADWLTGSAEISMADTARLVAANGTKLLRDFERFYPRRRHTFTLAGFENGGARVYVISNFEDCFGSSRNTIDDNLTVTTRALASGKKATVIVTGYKSAVSVDDRRLLGSVAGQYSEDGLRIRRRMADLNAAAAPRSRGMVSTDCVVQSFRIDGTGVMQLNRDATEVPQQFPHIMNGMNVTKLMTDALKGLGIDPTKTRLVQAAYASSGPGRQTLTSPASCRYAIKVPDPSTGYSLSEITSTEFAPMSARDISDRGQVVGTGQPQHGLQSNIPWSWHNGLLDRLNYTGVAQAVDNSGQIVAILQEPHQRAALFREGVLVELPLYHGEPGVFAGSDSAGIAINDQHTVAGNVRSQAEERGRPNMRAAMFREGQPTIILEGIPVEYACQAIDINENGQVLVVANPAAFDARSILWNPADSTWVNVGDDTTNVFPIALNDDGIVLGQGRNIHSHPVAVMCEPAGTWERLGTDDGWIPVDINNRGEVIGRVMIDGIDRPWLRRSTREIVLLPYATDHHTTPAAINNVGHIVGGATADRCSHAMMWEL